MSLVIRLASKLISRSNQGTNGLMVRDSHWYAIGALIGFITLAIPVFFSIHNTYATASSITVSIDDSTIDLNVAPTGPGAFSKSNTSTIGVSTTNYTGYTLSIAAQAGDNPTALVNGSDSSKTLPSIESALTESQFKALDATSYNNQWGYLPSNLCTTSNGTTTCAANTSFLPSPTTNGDTLDITSTANTTVNEYEITLGARVDTTATLGSYSNVFLVEAVANDIPYAITYNDGVVGSMPMDISSKTSDTTVTIANNVPTRTGYTFIGWCTVAPTHNANGNDTCPSPGTQVAAGGTLTISQTTSENNFTLYAMWSGNYTIEGLTYLQDFAGMSEISKAKIMVSMVPNEQHQLIDRRDDKVYWISLLEDGHIWMTQALDLDLNTNTTLNHTTSDIGWSEGNSSKTWTPQATANTISFEGGSGTSVSGWTNNNDEPYSASPYYGSAGNDVYVLSSGAQNTADTVTNLAGCTGTGKTTEECQHYKVGNYYNFAAATATNSVKTTIGGSSYTVVDADDGYVMPDSICPSGWRLPHGITGSTANKMTGSSSTSISRENNSEFDNLLYAYGITPSTGAPKGVNIGFASAAKAVEIRSAQLYFVRSGNVNGNTLRYRGTDGDSWSSTISTTSDGYTLDFDTDIRPAGYYNRLNGFPVRCLVR